METACRLPDDETQWSLLRQTESCWRAVRVFQGAGHPGSYTEIDCKLPDSCDKLLRSLSKLRVLWRVATQSLGLPGQVSMETADCPTTRPCGLC